MERKKKIRIIQLCLLSIGITALIFTYSDKINFKKDELLTGELKKEMKEAIDSEDYERASEIRDEINRRKDK